MRLEKDNVVKYTSSAVYIEELKALGYVEVTEKGEQVKEKKVEIKKVEKKEPAPPQSPLEKMTKKELEDLIKGTGVDVPKEATKDILISIAETLV